MFWVIVMIVMGLFLVVGLWIEVAQGRKKVGIGAGLIAVPLYIYFCLGVFAPSFVSSIMKSEIILFIISIPITIGAVMLGAWFVLPLAVAIAIMVFVTGPSWKIFIIAGFVTIFIVIATVGGISRRIGGGGAGGGNNRDKTIEHYDSWGERTGESKIKGDRIEHYDDWGTRTGESKIKGSKIEHHDSWGDNTGESRIKGKTIELYDSRGNRIGTSKIRGDTIEHRDAGERDKGESKVK